MDLKQTIRDRLGKNAELEWMFDMEFVSDTSMRTYLKHMALDTCANFVAKAAAQSTIRIGDGRWDYKLNVRPNKNQGAIQFWEEFFYKLIARNEVLVIISDSGDLLIADSFNREVFAVYDDLFKDVVVRDYDFKRSFSMSEVLYLQYSTQKLDVFMRGLFRDYGELFGRVLETAMRNYQIRAGVSFDASRSLGKDDREKLQNFLNKTFRAIREKAIAIFPLSKGFTYEEFSGKGSNPNMNLEELVKLKREIIDIVAEAIGIPTTLIHGDQAEVKENTKLFHMKCLSPLLRKLESELNAKIPEEREYLDGGRVEVIGIDRPNIFELAQHIDKLISSGAFSRNEVRQKTGYEPVAGLDAFVITKNYQELGGGEGNAEEDKH